MVWVKLNCLKSSDEWVTTHTTDTTTDVSFESSAQWGTGRETFLSDTGVNETDEVTNGHPNPS